MTSSTRAPVSGPRERAFERLLSLQALTSALSAAPAPAGVATAVIDHAVAALGAVAGSVMIVGDDGASLRLLGTRGYPPGVVEAYSPSFPLDIGSPAGEAVVTGEPVWVRSAAEMAERYPAHRAAKAATGTEALAAVPLAPSGRVVGVMGLSFAEKRDLEGDERAFILTVAGQCGLALERSLLYERERRARAEAERANVRLRASEERFRIISEITTDYAFGHFVGPDGALAVDWVSDSMARELGITAGALAADGWERFVHPDDLGEVRGHVERTRAGARDVCEYRVVAGDGGTRWVRSYSYPVAGGPDGRVSYIYIAAQDVTERKRAEAALRDSEERFRETFEQAGTGIAHVGPDGRFLRFNGKLCELLGYTAERLPEMTVREITHPEDVEADAALTRRLVDGELDSYALEKRYLRPDGSVLWTNKTATLVRDAGGAPLYVIAVLEDVSDRKRAERERAELLERERVAREQAEAASRTKDEFLATVSHELRSPLNAILGWSRLLASGKLDPAAAARAVEVIERNASAQAQLIEDLLDVSRIITGKLRLRVEPVNMVTVARAALDAVQPSAETKGIALEFSSSAGTVPVLGDSDRLRQVVWNLLSNSIKFTPSGGRVTLSVESAGDRARVVVADTGKGIGAEFLPHVFERFRQADGSPTRRFGGLGLGLAIVHHMAEMHGGGVEAWSEGEGKGATFTVTLPLIGAGDGGDRAPLARSDERDDGGEPRLSGVAVVVVDDEADTRELMATVLRQQGAEVRALGSAAEAYEAVATRRPDVLLADIAMPDEDGYSLIARVRALEGASETELPAAALTAYVRAEDRDRAIAAGFHLHVPKPVDPNRLVDVVASLAGREERPGAEA